MGLKKTPLMRPQSAPQISPESPHDRGWIAPERRGSLLLLRNPRSSELLVAGCWTSIVVTALMMVATSLVNMVEGYYRRNPIQLGFLILDFIAQAVIGVMWPLMTILLMRNARRDPQFCAMTPG